MANLLGKACVSLLALTACSALAAQDDRASNGLVLSMKSLSLDGDSNLVHLVEPKITRGGLAVTADEALATGTDFDARSEWQFKGHVRLEVDAAVLQADSAQLVFEKDKLATAELAGTPASITDYSKDRKEPVHGTAEKLAYNSAQHTLNLLGDVWFYKGRSEVHGCNLNYDFNDERFTAGSSDCGVRVRVMPTDAANGAHETHPTP